MTIALLNCDYDSHSNKTHCFVDAGEFRDWFWIGGKVSRKDALLWLSVLIEERLEEFHAGKADTPHEIHAYNAGLL